MMSPALKRVYHTNPIVWRILRDGGTLEDCVIELHEQNQRLVREVYRLEAIAPKRMRLNDGREMVWHCPDELVPISS